jgi:uncharacterized repeat protein (TIGR03847 family)
MSRQEFIFDPPERFVAGTVGSPGERSFFVQASSSGRVISVGMEKAQVALLAERLDALLDEVARRSDDSAAIPASTAVSAIDTKPLETPVVEEFRVGSLSLGWDTESHRVIIEAEEIGPGVTSPDGTADDVELAVLRVHLTPLATRSFSRRAERVVAAGRPGCPLCGEPLNPTGHICPRQNGYRRSAGDTR